MRNSYYHFTKSLCTFSLILIRRLAARRGAGAGLPAHGRSRRMLATARRKPHVHSMWKRLAGRPTAGAGPSPPTSTRCKVPSFCIGRALLPWIIRTRYGPQHEEKAACLNIACGSACRPDLRVTRGWCRPKSTHQQACKVPSFCIARAFLPWIIRTRYGPQPEEKAACSLHVEAPGGPTHG